MPRVRYIDEESREGELELARVKVGDVVRFLVDLHQLAGQKGTIDVKRGELGEVCAIGPENIEVSVPGQRVAAGDHFLEDCVIDPGLETVAVLVDARDPRISDNRVDESLRQGARMESWELELAIKDAQAAGVDPFDRMMVAAELVRRSFRRRQASASSAARLVADALPQAWQTFLLAMGLRQAQVGVPSPADVAGREDAQAGALAGPVLFRNANWAVTAMRAEFTAMHGRAPDIRNKDDVAWALGALISDLNLSLPGEVYSEPAARPELDNARQMANKLTAAQRALAAMTPEAWSAVVDDMMTPYQAPPRSPDEPPAYPPRYVPPVKMHDPAPSEMLRDEEEPAAPSILDPGDDQTAVNTDPEAAQPIGMPPGAGAGHIYADPGMSVFSRSKKTQGEVLGTEINGDGIVVWTENGTETWDPMDTIVNHRWKGPRRLVPMPVFDAWRKQRRRRTRGHTACYGVSYAGSDSDGEDRAADGLRRAARHPQEGGTHPEGSSGRGRVDRGDGRRETRATRRSGHNFGVFVGDPADDDLDRTPLTRP